MNTQREYPSRGVLLVDDHELIRLGLRTLFEGHAAAQGLVLKIFEARSLQDALAQYQLHRDSITSVLLDLHLPDAHGLSALHAFQSRYPQARIVVLSATSDTRMAQEALACGALAYHSKSGEMPDVVRFVCSDGAADPANTREDDGASVGTARMVSTLCNQKIALTQRQAEVNDYLLAGKSNREIAEAIGLSEGSVKNLVSTLLLLFGVRSRAQLISQLR